MHGKAFLLDFDVNAPGQVDFPRTLNIGIKDGLQVFPADDNTKGANRLLIFTGTTVNNILVGHDDNLYQGVFRVRLGFPLSNSVILKASATVAALASLHGEGAQEDTTFSADAAVTVEDPTDGGTVNQPTPPSPPLPSNELYVIIDAAIQGDGSRLPRISYQANVLVQDTEPDLDSILVRGTGGVFGPVAFNLARGFTWEYQLTLTGAVLQGDPPFNIPVRSDDKLNVPVNPAPAISSGGTTTGPVPGGKIGPATPDETLTITATGRHVTKTARLEILTPK
jgi:hypothetical protein